MTTFTNTELEAIRTLVIKTRSSIPLQKKTGLDLLGIEKIVEKLDNLIKESPSLQPSKSNKNIFDISTDYDSMIIRDTENDIEYKIEIDLVDNGKVIGYLINDRNEAINDIETWIGESNSESDKYLMRVDLEYLRESNEEYVFANYGTNGFIAKDVDANEFNKVCLELIESFVSYKKDR